MHFSSICKVSHFVFSGTICKIHFDFSPYNGSEQPFSIKFIYEKLVQNELF